MAQAIDAELQCVHEQDVTRAWELAQVQAPAPAPTGGQEGQQATVAPSVTALQEFTQAEATRAAAALNREMAKIKQKQENLKTEVDTLVTRMGQVQVSNDSTYDQIRTLTLQTEKWKTEVISMNKKYMEMLVESAGLESEEVHTNNTALKTTLERSERCVKDTSKTAVLEHDKRALYVLTDNKAKFPNFEGHHGENVYQFMDKFKRAIVANQVAERDKVSKPSRQASRPRPRRRW